jgi:hypothetical protein
VSFTFPANCKQPRDRAVFAAAVKRRLITAHNAARSQAERDRYAKALRIVGYWYSRFAQELGLQSAGQETALEGLRAEAAVQTKWPITAAMLDAIDYETDRAATRG